MNFRKRNAKKIIYLFLAIMIFISIGAGIYYYSKGIQNLKLENSSPVNEKVNLYLEIEGEMIPITMKKETLSKFTQYKFQFQSMAIYNEKKEKLANFKYSTENHENIIKKNIKENRYRDKIIICTFILLVLILLFLIIKIISIFTKTKEANSCICGGEIDIVKTKNKFYVKCRKCNRITTIAAKNIKEAIEKWEESENCMPYECLCCPKNHGKITGECKDNCIYDNKDSEPFNNSEM